jgi:hypothetical protein
MRNHEREVIFLLFPFGRVIESVEVIVVFGDLREWKKDVL